NAISFRRITFASKTNNNLLSFPYGPELRRPVGPQCMACVAMIRLAQDGSGPLALPEYRHTPAIGVKTVDVDLARTDHPVDVDQARVAALRCDLLRRQLRPVDKTLRIAL